MTKTTEKAETKITLDDVRGAARKSALAYVGLYGLAYERAQLRLGQLKTRSGDLVETLVKRGEVIEEKGLELTKDARAKAAELRRDTVETVSKVVPLNRADRRVEELEAEVTALNKKIKALSKKAATPRAKTTKTVKVEKKAA